MTRSNRFSDVSTKMQNYKKGLKIMLKKIISGLVAVMMLVVSSVTLTGCAKKDNFGLTGVVSNGGLGVIKDGYLYYVAGGTDEFEDTDWRALEASSIYKRAVDEAGNPVEGTAPELLYSGIAGFEYGELHIFGEYLYFATPSGKLSNTAEKMTDRTDFCRIRLDGKKFEVLHTTETEEDLTYAYYTPNDDELYLVVLEGEELYSINIKKGKKIEIATGVSSVAFASDYGRGNGADKYLFYTKSPDESYLTQTGYIVYRATADNKTNENIASGADYALYEVKFGYLYYSVDGKVYRTTSSVGLDRTNIVSYEILSDMFFTENGGVVGTGKTSGYKNFVYARWVNGAKVEGKILNTSEKCVAYAEKNGVLYATNDSNAIVKLALDSGETESDEATKFVEIGTLTVGNALTAEIIGDYIYYFTETKTTDDNGNELKTWNLQTKKIK